MMLRPAARFTSDLPDDFIKNEEGTAILQYGGKSVIEAIAVILARLGCVVGARIHPANHGWGMYVRYGKRDFWCHVCLIQPYVFYFGDTAIVRNFLKRPHPVHVDILTRLAQELASDPRFHDILWFRKEDVLAGLGGAPEPVSYRPGEVPRVGEQSKAASNLTVDSMPHRREGLPINLLTVSANGQITLQQDTLRQIGVSPGDQIEILAMPDCELRIRALQRSGDIASG